MKRHAKLFTGELWGFGEGGFWRPREAVRSDPKELPMMIIE